MLLLLGSAFEEVEEVDLAILRLWLLLRLRLLCIAIIVHLCLRLCLCLLSRQRQLLFNVLLFHLRHSSRIPTILSPLSTLLNNQRINHSHLCRTPSHLRKNPKSIDLPTAILAPILNPQNNIIICNLHITRPKQLAREVF